MFLFGGGGSGGHDSTHNSVGVSRALISCRKYPAHTLVHAQVHVLTKIKTLLKGGSPEGEQQIVNGHGKGLPGPWVLISVGRCQLCSATWNHLEVGCFIEAVHIVEEAQAVEWVRSALIPSRLCVASGHSLSLSETTSWSEKYHVP